MSVLCEFAASREGLDIVFLLHEIVEKMETTRPGSNQWENRVYRMNVGQALINPLFDGLQPSGLANGGTNNRPGQQSLGNNW